MAFTVKDWQDTPSTATPITAAALEDMETRLSDYAATPDVLRTTVNMAGTMLLPQFALAMARFDTVRDNSLAAWDNASGDTTPSSTATVTSGSGNLTLVSPTTGWKNGMSVSGTGIGAGAFITGGAGTATMAMSVLGGSTGSSRTITGTDRPSNLYIPSTGYYMCAIQPGWDPQRTGDNRAWHLQVNPAKSYTNAVMLAAHSDVSLWNASFPGCWMGSLTAGDVLQIWVYHENAAATSWGGANRPLTSLGVSRNCEWMLCKLGV